MSKRGHSGGETNITDSLLPPAKCECGYTRWFKIEDNRPSIPRAKTFQCQQCGKGVKVKR